MTSAELLRYSRHLSMPEFGPQGQNRLREGSVLCIGAGGLGSPAISYLAAAGVGRIGIVDADVVDASNLQRQLLFSTGDIGRPKVDAATDRVREINPHVTVEKFPCRFTAANAREIAGRFDIILDGSDNFATRYLSSDVAAWLAKANIYASVMKFDAQVAVFAPHLGGPCYRCMFPQPPPPGAVPGCAEAGVLGVLPGLAGTLQATEAIKLLTGIGEPMIGRLLHIDAMRMKFREFKLRRDPGCVVCGENPSITQPVDYDAFCGPPAPCRTAQPANNGGGDAASLSVEELSEILASPPADFLLLDVRETYEVAIAAIPGARHIPLGQLERRLGELRRDADIAVHCKSGGRSAQAVALLKRLGFARARNVSGGIAAWSERIDPTVARY
jgi:adenylyltransferase/sulfurtransferase